MQLAEFRKPLDPAAFRRAFRVIGGFGIACLLIVAAYALLRLIVWFQTSAIPVGLG